MPMMPSSLGLLTIEPAQPDDLPTVLEILAEAARWLQEKHIEQWQFPPPPGLSQFLAVEIDKGEVYLARTVHDAAAVGILRFAWRDPDLWGDDVGAEAGYVYTMAIRPSLHGCKLGETLLDWAKTHVRSRNRRYLRLDCVATNLALRRYYERLGFRFCGEATHLDFTGALYEFPLSVP
ncbi:MAG: GNAT family N-acetyltransferase [Caldilineaceae bacterium]